MKSTLFCLATLVIGLYGCRLGQGNSGLQDLDNFTRSETTPHSKNQCSGFFTDPADKKDMDDWLKIALPSSQTPTSRLSNSYFNLTSKDHGSLEVVLKSLSKSLSAVPVNLQQAYFATGGKIVVDDNVNSICLGEYQKLKVHARIFVGEGLLPIDDLTVNELVPNGNPSSQPASVRNLEVSGCWVLVAESFDNLGNPISWHPQLVLNGKIAKDAQDKNYASEIEHSTVRLFGYLLSQILAHIDVSVSDENVFDVSKIESKSANDLFTREVKKLVDAVRLDIFGDLKNTSTAKNPSNDFFYYVKDLRKLDAEKARLAKDPKAKISKEIEELEMAMYHYTFAEAFDSYHCNNETNTRMQSGYSKTYEIFYSTDSQGRQIGLAAELDYIQIDSSAFEDSGFNAPGHGYQFASLGSSSLAYQYASQQIAFLRLFRGIGSAVGAVFRGMGRFVAGAVRVVSNVVNVGRQIIVGGAQLVGRAAVGLVKGSLYVAGRVVGHASAALAPQLSSHLASYRSGGPFRRGFTDATRVWFPVSRGPRR
jgi:hypothetical protein